MAFNSAEYFFFFPTIVALYFLCPPQLRWIVLVLGNFFFYMSWKPEYGLLLAATILMDWSIGLMLERSVKTTYRKMLVTVSVIGNLSILLFFKYSAFVAINLHTFFNFSPSSFFTNVILPIGISFYIFQSIAYVVDVYRGSIPAERHLGRYAAFVSFFPHLVAGPILRPSNILPQMHVTRSWDWKRFRTGAAQMLIGLFKKVVVADRLALSVATAYAIPSDFSGWSLLLATYFFAFQIYFDFSGYTDIAIGSAKILGYDLPPNFQQPYLSASITEFWRRWHISLSSWLREYLYIPLGGNRQGTIATYRNLFITMLLGGLWHGADWKFVIWGSFHGVFLAIERFFKQLSKSFTAVPAWFVSFCKLRIIQVILTFHIVCIGWIFFRAENFTDALLILSRIADLVVHPFAAGDVLLPAKQMFLYLCIILGIIVYDVLDERELIIERLSRLTVLLQGVLALTTIFFILLFGVLAGPEFIYFQF